MTAVLKTSGNVPFSKLLLARFGKLSNRVTKVCLASLVGTGSSSQINLRYQLELVLHFAIPLN